MAKQHTPLLQNLFKVVISNDLEKDWRESIGGKGGVRNQIGEYIMEQTKQGFELKEQDVQLHFLLTKKPTVAQAIYWYHCNTSFFLRERSLL